METGDARPEKPDALRILLIDDDELLLHDAAGLEHAFVSFTTSRSTAEARLRCAGSDYDVAVICLDLGGGEDFVREITRRNGAPSVIAIGGRGAGKITLEHKLLRAELRGARMTLPKPIDAVEIAIASISVSEQHRALGDAGASAIADLERRLAY